MSQRILVLTKDRSTATSISAGLEKRGYMVSASGSKQRVLTWAASGKADFVVVDASASLDKGLEVCAALRASDEQIRIILAVTSRRRLPAEQVDACLVLPMTARKIHYRLQVLLQGAEPPLLRVGDVTLDPKSKTMRRDEHEVKLTPKETLLLQLLMERAGKVVPRKDIMKHVWDTDYTGDTRTIDVHVRWLRLKLEPSPAHPVYIKTIRRRGYVFDAPAHPHTSVALAQTAPQEAAVL